MPENGIPDSDQRMVDFPAVVFGHLVVQQSGASRIPCGGPARTYVVGWVQQLVQELSYLSMGDGHPWQTHPPNHHTPPHMVEVSPLADVRRRSVQPAGVDAWVSTDWKNLCRPRLGFEVSYPSGSGLPPRDTSSVPGPIDL